MSKFKKGDIVSLKDLDGPSMTINMDISPTPDSPYYECVWFDKSNKLQVGKFSGETLILDSESGTEYDAD